MGSIKICDESSRDILVAAVDVNKPSTFRRIMSRTRTKAKSSYESKRLAEERRRLYQKSSNGIKYNLAIRKIKLKFEPNKNRKKV